MHDMNGNPLAVGDNVNIPCTVTDCNGSPDGKYCNVTVAADVKMGLDDKDAYTMAFTLNAKQVAKVMAMLLFLFALIGCGTGCATSRVVTPGTPGGTNSVGVYVAPTADVTNTVVNQAVVTIESLGLQIAASVATSAILIQNPSSRVTLQEISTALNGVLNGATPGTVQQVVDMVGGKDPALAQQIPQFIALLSGYEQKLIAKFGARVAGQVVLPEASAFAAGIQQGLDATPAGPTVKPGPSIELYPEDT